MSGLTVAPPLRAERGDLVQISVTGTYSPTCALKLANTKPEFRDPNVQESGWGAMYEQYQANPAIHVPDGAMTGPYGFALGFEQSRWTTRSTTEQDLNGAKTIGQAAPAIGGAIGSIWGPAGAAVGGAIGGVVGAIASLFGDNSSSSSGSGVTNTTRASFTAGLRVNTAPFPSMSVGALLAVKATPQGVIRDIQIAASPSTLAISEPTDVYLVINDRACGSTGGGQLDVTLRRLRTLGGVAAKVQPVVVGALANIQRQAAEKFIDQGTLLSSDLASMRSQAQSLLTTSCPECLQAEYAPMLHFFQSAVENALNQVERRTAITRLRREIALLSADLATLAENVSAASRVSQMVSLRQAWAAKNLDITQFRDKARWLASVIDVRLYPFLQVKYPETLRGLASGFPLVNDPAFFELVDYDWTNDWGVLANRLRTATDGIKQQLAAADADFEKQYEQPVTITIAIPRPRTMVDPSNNSTYSMEQIDGDIYAPNYAKKDPTTATGYANYTPPFRELPSSAEVSNAIVSNRPASFTITPELLYNSDDPSKYKYPGQLTCIDTVPVITSIGLTVLNNTASDNNQWDALYEPIVMQSDRIQRFIGADGPTEFVGSNEAWLWFSVPLRYSTTEP